MKYLTEEELQREMQRRLASPVKQARVNGYMHSRGMTEAINMYKDNDCTRGIVTVKPQTNKYASLVGSAVKKEVWKPKVSLNWYEPYRTRLTL